MERSGSNPHSRSRARTVFIFVLREPEPGGDGRPVSRFWFLQIPCGFKHRLFG